MGEKKKRKKGNEEGSWNRNVYTILECKSIGGRRGIGEGAALEQVENEVEKVSRDIGTLSWPLNGSETGEKRQWRS